MNAMDFLAQRQAQGQQQSAADANGQMAILSMLAQASKDRSGDMLRMMEMSNSIKQRGIQQRQSELDMQLKLNTLKRQNELDALRMPVYETMLKNMANTGTGNPNVGPRGDDFMKAQKADNMSKSALITLLATIAAAYGGRKLGLGKLIPGISKAMQPAAGAAAGGLLGGGGAMFAQGMYTDDNEMAKMRMQAGIDQANYNNATQDPRRAAMESAALGF